MFILHRDTYINMKIYGNAWDVKFQVLEGTYLRRAKILGRTQEGMLMSSVFYILSCLVDTQVHADYALYLCYILIFYKKFQTLNIKLWWDCPVDPVAKMPHSHAPNAGGQVQSLVRELDPTCHSWEFACQDWKIQDAAPKMQCSQMNK